MKEFGEMVGDEGDRLGCVAGREGFFVDDLRYGFVGEGREEEGVDELAEVVRE
ncbi:hypothetical protein [Bacillus sp. WP8]|uniref:hypothetical protein n=1 Tax=Bacillus sp. WP8 TaxID=756828 RepID=UPI001642425D|nr:hypothetical protein [Bacillus sp. WP8]